MYVQGKLIGKNTKHSSTEILKTRIVQSYNLSIAHSFWQENKLELTTRELNSFQYGALPSLIVTG